MKRLGVVGAGSWGTALAVHFARWGKMPVTLWARRPELAAGLVEEKQNSVYLPGVELPESLRPTSNLVDLVDCDPILLVVPSHGFRLAVRELLSVLPTGRTASAPTLVSATKGIENETLARMSQVIFEESTAADRDLPFAVLSGPGFAAEVARGMPTAHVIASEDHDLAARLREDLSTSRLRFYSSSDVVGVELGAAAKNVIAIAAGVVAGLDLGHNALAALITRGLAEITRLGRASGGQARTFSGLAGLGDLVLTCTGGLSRNRRTGLELARGKTLAQIQAATTQVAEGIRTSKSIHGLAERLRVDMPITAQMVRVLYEDHDPALAVEELMSRDLKSETEG